MPLKIQLKEDEKFVVNGAVIQARSRGRGIDLWIMNQAQVLRARQIMKEDEADTLEKKLYMAVQVMYLFPQDDQQAREAFELIAQQMAAERPELAQDLREISGFVAEGSLYQALKRCGRLVDGEEEVQRA